MTSEKEKPFLRVHGKRFLDTQCFALAIALTTIPLPVFSLTPTPIPADINEDGVVDVHDLMIIQSDWKHGERHTPTPTPVASSVYQGWLSPRRQEFDGCSYHEIWDCTGNTLALVGEKTLGALVPYEGQYVSVTTEIDVCGSGLAGNPLMGAVVTEIEVVDHSCWIPTPLPQPANEPLELGAPGEEAGDRIGWSVSGVPDIDGDGGGDVVVGTAARDPDQVHLFSGETGMHLMSLTSPNPEPFTRFGRSVSGLADTDGDGRGDILVGAYGADPGESPEDAGRAYLFSGSTGSVLHTFVSPNEKEDGEFGKFVSGLSDIDGDGRGDVLIGGYLDFPDESPFRAGRAYVFSGSTGTLLRTLISPDEKQNGRFGEWISGVPDADGDGLGDVVVGQRGHVYVFSATGGLLQSLISPQEEQNDEFPMSLSGVPDVDGDERGDIAVGAIDHVFLFSGATGSLLRTLNSPNVLRNDRFGQSVVGIPDIDGDNLGDIIVGAQNRAYIFSGGTGVPILTLHSPHEQSDGEFGWSVSCLQPPESNTPGAVIVGAYQETSEDGPVKAGRVYVYHQLLGR